LHISTETQTNSNSVTVGRYSTICIKFKLILLIDS
jgi:hypothetical protein